MTESLGWTETFPLLTKFPLKEVLGVNGVLGPRARAHASFNLEPLMRARADPGPLSLRGPLSKEIVFSVPLELFAKTLETGNILQQVTTNYLK